MADSPFATFRTDPAKALAQFVRIFSSTGGEITFSAARGRLCVGDGVHLPQLICGFHTVRAHYFEQRGDAFVERLLAGILPVALESDEVLKSFTSPFSGNETAPALSPYLRAYLHCPERGTLRADPASGEPTSGSIWSGDHLQPFQPEWSHASGVGWVNYTNPHELLGKTWADSYRFRFSLEALAQTGTASVPSVYAYSGESPAPSWLEAPDGYQAFWQAYGQKCRSPAEVPDSILKSTRSTMPSLYEDPQTWK
jgi:hypothetical protein